MKYVFLVLMLIVAGAVIYTVTRDAEEVMPKPKPALDEPAVAAPAPGEVKGSTPAPAGGNAPTTSASSVPDLTAVGTLTAPPEIGDSLVDGFAALLSELALRKISVGDKAAFQARIRKLLDGAQWGNPGERDKDAADIAEALTAQVEKSFPKDRPATDTLQPFQLAAITDMSKRIAGAMRGQSVATSQPGAKSHLGAALNAAVDFEAPKGYHKISWQTIGSFLYKEGMTLPPEVVLLNKKKVAVGGYMMSLGEYGNIHKFLLVEAQWSCCFGEPPDINQVIVVKIPAERKGIELTSLPVMVVGTFDAAEEKDGRWVVSVYRLLADDVQEID